MTNVDQCTTKIAGVGCPNPARWTVTVTGHPNVPGGWSHPYCTEHARLQASTLWEDSPTPYRITVEGPTGDPSNG